MSAYLNRRWLARQVFMAYQCAIWLVILTCNTAMISSWLVIGMGNMIMCNMVKCEIIINSNMSYINV